MTPPAVLELQCRLFVLRTTLLAWLVDEAYPVWSLQGIDPHNGGFIETIGQDGKPLPLPRRARVHPRQVYAFAQAPQFGWQGDARGIVRRGVDYFAAHYARADGLFRTLADVDGTPLDDRALLYDQAFALLGLASAAHALEARGEFEARALDLRRAIRSGLAACHGALRSCDEGEGWHEANPHMHLLEACLAWADVGADPGWAEWARDIVDLARTRFIRRDSGALGEAFAATWEPAPSALGRLIEPGHQFEWAWLMLRYEALQGDDPELRTMALRLIEIGECFGVHNAVAVNSLNDDLTVRDADARFWPQTERLKAALLAAELTGELRYWVIAHAAAASFIPYLNTPVRGLWFDVQRPDGTLTDSPAPASTFYHLIGALVALNDALERLS